MPLRLSFSTLLATCLLFLTAHIGDTAGSIQSPASPARGVFFHLSIPHGPYVRRELIRASITLENRSSRAIFLQRCESPRAEVYTAAGRMVYPPIFPSGPSWDCGGYLPPLRLPAGRSLTRRQYLVLLGSKLRPVAAVSGSPAGKPRLLWGTDRTLTLQRGQGPVIRMRRGSHWSADVRPHGPVSGPLLFADWFRCDRRGGGESGHLKWTASSSRHLAPEPNRSCRAVIQWHIAAGWLGHPVGYANVDSTKPSRVLLHEDMCAMNGPRPTKEREQ